MDEAHRADFINEHFYTFYSNSYDQAVVLGEEALAISQKNKIAATEALSLKNLGIVHYLKGNYEQALHFYQQSLDRYESLKDPAGQGNVLREMANYFKKTGQHDKALENMDEAIRLCTEAGDTSCLTASLDIQGVVFLETGRLEEAQARHRVKWEWIKGHAGHPENERADELARAGMAPFKPKKARANDAS